MKIEEYLPGKHIYGSWLVVDENVDAELKKSFRTGAMVYTYKQLIDLGFQSIVLRASNIKSSKIYKARGGEVLSEGGLEVGGEKIQLWLYRLKFDSPVFQALLQA